ncbi:hypothetical protein [Spirobacillus cienkowskii]|uniref:hypothetical protein n=1 Tax=Spirobacillus cienkowskii TaxID=495820 RepID=UPI0030D200AD
MKLKNSVKLSALSLSLVALAVTSCGGSSNDKKDEKVTTGKTTDPDVAGKGGKEETGKPEALKAFDASKVKTLHVNEKLSIPQFGCANPTIEIELEDNKKSVVDPTSEELVVKFVGENSNKFTFEKGQVCAVKESKGGVAVPVVGDKGVVEFVLKNNTSVRKEAALEVVPKEAVKASVKAVHVASKGFDPNSSSSLESNFNNAKKELRIAESNAVHADGTTGSLLPFGYDRLSEDEQFEQKLKLVNNYITAAFQPNYNKFLKLQDFKVQVSSIKYAYVAIKTQLDTDDLKDKASTPATLITASDLNEISRTPTILNALIGNVATLKATLVTDKDAAQKAFDAKNGKSDATEKTALDAAIAELQKVTIISEKLQDIKIAYNKITRDFDSLASVITVTGYTRDGNIPYVKASAPNTTASEIEATLTTDINALNNDVSNYNAISAVQKALTFAKSSQEAYVSGGVVSVPAGSKATISVSKTVNGANKAQPLSVEDEVFVYDNFDNKLVAKVLPADSKVNYSSIEFTAPKVKTNGKVAYKISVNSVESTFYVEVTAAKFTAFDLISASGAQIPQYSVLNQGETYFASILAYKTDDTKVNLTYDAPKTTSNFQQVIPSVYSAAADPALPNYLRFSSSTNATFDPKPLSIQLGDEKLSLKFYVGAKPVIQAATFNVNSTALPANSLKVAVGSINDVATKCAKLAAVNYDLGTNKNLPLTIVANDIQLSLSNSEKFNVVQPNQTSDLYVCATEKAQKGDAVTVTVQSKHDSSVNKTFTFTAEAVYQTSRYVVVNGSELAKYGYGIKLSDANKSQKLDIRYLMSDGSLSNAAVAVANVNVVLDPSTSNFFEIDTTSGSYEVKLKSDAASKLDAAKIASHVIKISAISSSAVDQPHADSVITIPVSYTK